MTPQQLIARPLDDRAELTPAQRAAAIKRRKQIWEVLHPEIQVAQIAPPEIGYGKPPPQEQAFAADTATITGETKRDINRHLARADALGDDLAAVAGTSLDKGVELDALKALPASQRALVAASFLEYEREQARKRQAHGETAPGVTLRLNFDEANSDSGRATTKAGAKFGVSGDSVFTAAKVLEKAEPEIIKAGAHPLDKSNLSPHAPANAKGGRGCGRMTL